MAIPSNTPRDGGKGKGKAGFRVGPKPRKGVYTGKGKRSFSDSNLHFALLLAYYANSYVQSADIGWNSLFCIYIIADKIKRALIEKAKTKKAYYKTLKAEGIDPSSSTSQTRADEDDTATGGPKQDERAEEEEPARGGDHRDRKGKRRANSTQDDGRRPSASTSTGGNTDPSQKKKKQRVSAEEVEALRRRREEERKAWAVKGKNGRQPRMASRMDVLLGRIERGMAK
jgi:hypothetical protein